MLCCDSIFHVISYQNHRLLKVKKKLLVRNFELDVNTRLNHFYE